MPDNRSSTQVANWLHQLGFAEEQVQSEMAQVAKMRTFVPGDGSESGVTYIELAALRALAGQLADRHRRPTNREAKELVMRYVRQRGADYRANYAITRLVLRLLELCLTYEIGALARGQKDTEQVSVESVEPPVDPGDIDERVRRILRY